MNSNKKERKIDSLNYPRYKNEEEYKKQLEKYKQDFNSYVKEIQEERKKIKKK
jgi:hypothetical protein